MPRRSIAFWLFALLLPPALAQTQPDVAEILKKVAETYEAATQYEIVSDATTRNLKTGKEEVMHMSAAFKAPGKYRIQGAMPGFIAGRPDFSDMTMVYDGSTLWFYLPKSHQYASFPASALTAQDAGDLYDMSPEVVDVFLIGLYRIAVNFTARAKFLRLEEIGVAGAKAACYVLSVSPDDRQPSQTWWVDTKRYVVLRSDEAASSTVFTTVKLGDPIPPERFVFVLPPGATKLEMTP